MRAHTNSGFYEPILTNHNKDPGSQIVYVPFSAWFFTSANTGADPFYSRPLWLHYQPDRKLPSTSVQTTWYINAQHRRSPPDSTASALTGRETKGYSTKANSNSGCFFVFTSMLCLCVKLLEAFYSIFWTPHTYSGSYYLDLHSGREYEYMKLVCTLANTKCCRNVKKQHILDALWKYKLTK